MTCENQPECVDGYIRVPVVTEVMYYGSREKRANIEVIECEECARRG